MQIGLTLGPGAWPCHNVLDTVHDTVQETDCTGGMTHTEWCNPCLTADDKLHPTTFTADMVSQESMARMREDLLKFCNVSAAEALAGVSFVSAAQLAAGQECGQRPPLR